MRHWRFAMGETNDLSGHLSQSDLGARMERPVQYRGTRTDWIETISDKANSAVAAT
jgi:hypothetical protein